MRVRACHFLRGVLKRLKLRILLSRTFQLGLCHSVDAGLLQVGGFTSVDIFDNDKNFDYAQTEKRDCHKM